MAKIEDYPIFNNHWSTIKETSESCEDGINRKYLSDSEKPAINFDKIKEEYVEGLHLSKFPCSNDALLQIKDGSFLFVEFKSGKIDKGKEFEIRKKIYDSVLIFSDITKLTISDMRNYVDYILVYDSDKCPQTITKSRDYIANKVAALAGTPIVGFGLGIFKTYCFHSVNAYTCEQFDAFAKDLDVVGQKGKADISAVNSTIHSN